MHMHLLYLQATSFPSVQVWSGEADVAHKQLPAPLGREQHELWEPCRDGGMSWPESAWRRLHGWRTSRQEAPAPQHAGDVAIHAENTPGIAQKQARENQHVHNQDTIIVPPWHRASRSGAETERQHNANQACQVAEYPEEQADGNSCLARREDKGEETGIEADRVQPETNPGQARVLLNLRFREIASEGILDSRVPCQPGIDGPEAAEDDAHPHSDTLPPRGQRRAIPLHLSS